MVVTRYMTSLETSYLERDDLEQLGYIGLIEAVKGFDVTKGFKFSSYASTAILGYITRGLRVSIPNDKRYSKGGKIVNVISLDESIPEAENLTYLDTIEDENAQAAFEEACDRCDQAILKKEIRQTMNRVFFNDDREGQAVALRYGLNDMGEHTYKEVGETMGVTLERSRQMVNKGIRRIKQSKAGYELKRKYLVEFGLEPRKKKICRLEHRDPIEILVEFERWKENLLNSFK